jgi:thymidylate kinase
MPSSEMGRLFIFEGPNGCGKTVISRLFAEHLNAVGIPSQWHAFPGRQPGTLGLHVYDIHRNHVAVGIETIRPASLQALHIAAHIDQIETRILPALRQGITVVLDRFWWSTWVYGLSTGVPEKSLRRMLHVEQFHWEGTRPNAVFLFECEKPFDEPFSAEWDGLRQAYDALAATERSRHSIIRIRNEGDPMKALAEAVLGVHVEFPPKR